MRYVTLAEPLGKHAARHVTLHLRLGTLSLPHVTLATWHFKRDARLGTHEMR
jgi:hypothetical protein